MVTYTAAVFTAAAPVAAPRSGGGALSEADCPAQPAGNAPDERRAMRARRGRRGRRADTRVTGVRQHWQGVAAGAGPGGGCSKSSEAEVTVQGVLSRLPSSSAPCGPAAGDEIGEPTGIEEVGTEEGHCARGSPRRPCRPSQRAWRGCTECREHTEAGCRRATSHAGSSQAMRSRSRSERRRGCRPLPFALGPRGGRQASWRFWRASRRRRASGRRAATQIFAHRTAVRAVGRW